MSCLVAVHEGRIAGFVAYEATCRDYVGPVGVAPAFRGRQIAQALMCAALHAMADLGHAYAVIGGVKELAPSMARNFQAMPIPGSTPGIYTDRLRPSDPD